MNCAACGRTLEAQEAIAFWARRFGATPPVNAVAYVCRPLRSLVIPCFARAVHGLDQHIIATVVEGAAGPCFVVHPHQIRASATVGGIPARPHAASDTGDARGEVASQPRTLATSPETVEAYWAGRRDVLAELAAVR